MLFHQHNASAIKAKWIKARNIGSIGRTTPLASLFGNIQGGIQNQKIGIGLL
jgi:hypothetical protein